MYLSIVQLAESFGVEEAVVEDWVRHESLPCVTDRGRRLFDRAQVITWAAQRGRAAQAGFLAAQPSALHTGLRLEPLLRNGGIWRDATAARIAEIFKRVVDRLPGASAAVRQLLAQRLTAPDGISWAAVGQGLALPHLRAPVALGRDSGVLALLILSDAVGQSGPDSVPITRLLFFVAPSPRAHLELLGQLSSALRAGPLRQLILEAAPDDRIFAALAKADSTEHRSAGAKEQP
jgi:PTS system nitrogen regulatory IIA component